jgi:hypothetical protein
MNRLPRLGGAMGNGRLTVALALVLLVLLSVEVLTTLGLRSYLAVHLFVGLLLVPVVSLKLASTSWRAARYYTGSADYHRLGPPQIVLRVLAPLLVGATLVLFGSGVAFLAGGSIHALQTIHVFAFAVWGGLMVVHVLAYLPRVLRGALNDWRPPRLAGGRMRRTLVFGSLVAGVVVAIATMPVQHAWLALHHGDGVERKSSAR